jgi:hypothetical protein
VRRPAALLVAVAALACGGGADPRPAAGGDGAAAAYFVEAATDTGLDFVHFNGMSGEYYMAEVTGSGAALFDYDGDGDLDVYFVQGRMLGPGKSAADAHFPSAAPTDRGRLYRNRLVEEGRLAFEDVTDGAVPPHTGYGMGVASGDYDGDGDPDLYLTHLGRNQLLRNEGDGTFRDVTDAAGAGDERWSVPAAFLDYDRDGDLDLFVGNYVDFPFDDPPVCNDFAGEQDYCGPDSFTPQADRLFENLGPGADGEVRFAVVTGRAGLTGGFGPALGVVAADFDGDGWTDLYVANDQKPNNLWVNQGDGTFRDEALLAGAAINAEGKAEASMGVDGGDFDGDGDLDLFMTHLVTETNTLYRNDGHGMFDDHTDVAGLGPASRPYTSFGTGFLDVDNDGWLDLLVVNGAVKKLEALVRRGDPFPLHEPNQLFRNLGGDGGPGRYADVTAAQGGALSRSEVSRGAAFGDLDNDGDTDVVISNNNGPARLLLNTAGQQRPWIGLRLVAGQPPRDALGARAAVRRDGRPPLWRWVRTAGSFCSANDPRLLFGLGDSPHLTAVRVVWPDGAVEEWRGLEAGRYHTLSRGEGTPAAGGAVDAAADGAR